MEQLTIHDRVDAGGPAQLSVLGAMWRHRWAVGLVLVAFGAFGFFLIDSRAVDYVATAGLIVEDPRASSVEVTDFGQQSTQDSERYLADQVEILRSNEAAAIAAELTAEEFSTERLLAARSVSGESTSNLIEISVRASSPQRSKIGADALLEAYPLIRRSQVQATAEAALAELDALTVAIENDLEAIGEQIRALEAADEDRVELETQFSAAVGLLNRLRIEREPLAVGSEQRLAIDLQIAELLQDFETWRLVLGVEVSSGPMAVLLAEQEAAIAERAALAARRNAIAIDAELAAEGVTLASPALLPTEPAGIGDAFILAGSLALGLAVAGVVAYSLSLRRQAFISREVPESILGAPLLAEIPDFVHEGISSPLPSKDDPLSAAAEAFRFVASAIDIRASATDARSVGVLSATVGGGKTTLVANAGMAAAREGQRILLVDADFGSQELTRLMVDETPEYGITDIVNGNKKLIQATVYITQEDGRSVSLLSKGSLDVDAASFFQSVLTRELFAQLSTIFDLVLIDCPPLLQVAYASSIATYADASVVLVEHRSSAAHLTDVADRVKLIGTPVLGYVYTKAPLRREMTSGVGSTAHRFDVADEPESDRWWRRNRRSEQV